MPTVHTGAPGFNLGYSGLPICLSANIPGRQKMKILNMWVPATLPVDLDQVHLLAQAWPALTVAGTWGVN